MERTYYFFVVESEELSESPTRRRGRGTGRQRKRINNLQGNNIH